MYSSKCFYSYLIRRILQFLLDQGISGVWKGKHDSYGYDKEGKEGVYGYWSSQERYLVSFMVQNEMDSDV